MHILRLLLDTTKADCQEINRRFYAYYKVYNIAVTYIRKRLTRLSRNKDYQLYKSEYVKLIKKDKLNKQERLRKKELSDHMSEIRNDLGLSKGSLFGYLKIAHKKYKNLLSSQQVQAIGDRVLCSLDDYLFSDGTCIHYKKFQDIHTIGGKSNLNGVKFRKETDSIDWMGLIIPVVIKDTTGYVKDSIDRKIKYCTIERKMFPNGYHYYVILTLDGPAPKKLTLEHTDQICGIDPGVSSVAAVSDTGQILSELAPNYKDYNRQIEELNRKIEQSKQIHNPNKYNEDGTYKKGNKEKWVYTNTCKKMFRKRKTLYRQKSEYIRHSHAKLCNWVLQMARNFIVEAMNYKGLMRRGKKPAERTEKVSEVKGKLIRKYKKKKRFGSSISNRSPALFLQILKQKCDQYGLGYQTVDPRIIKASQYDHVKDEYKKVPLKQRWKEIGGESVQRDLYSAYLLQHIDIVTGEIERNGCISDFEQFVKRQDELVRQMKEEHISMKQCFGF